MRTWMLSCLLVAAACNEAPTAPHAASRGAPKRPAAAPHTPALDGRDQYQLAREIEAAQEAGDDEAVETVARAWRDRRFQWEVFVSPPLCRRADACHVVPFDNTRAGVRLVEGWLPRLALDAAGKAAVDAACAGHPRCVLRFEGTLADFTLSTVLPTALTFDAVKVLDARDAAPAERWFARRS